MFIYLFFHPILCKKIHIFSFGSIEDTSLLYESLKTSITLNTTSFQFDGL